MIRRTLFTILFAVLFLAASSNAFDGRRKGFVLGGGLGIGPLARTTVDGGPNSLDKSGLAINFIIGYAWDARNMMVLYRDAIVYSEETVYGDNIGIAQGFTGAAWFHYLGPVGRTPFVVVGLGLQDFTSLDRDYKSNDRGLGILLGSGYEFTRHFQFYGSISLGQTSASGVDFNHAQLTLGVSGVAF